MPSPPPLRQHLPMRLSPQQVQAIVVAARNIDVFLIDPSTPLAALASRARGPSPHC
jgi:hypothetical protein